MENDKAPQMAQDKDIQIPEWEHAGVKHDGGAATTSRPTGASLGTRLDRVLPPHRKYLGMRRKVFLLVLGAATLALLALIIGLAAGLTTGSKKWVTRLAKARKVADMTADTKTYLFPQIRHPIQATLRTTALA